MNNNIVIKLIALDLDGTLLQRRGKIHPANLKMLARIYEEKPDIKIIIATGRPMKHTINYAKACQIANNSGHIICYNGASIIDISNEQAKILQTKTITTSQVAKLLIFIKNKKLVL